MFIALVSFGMAFGSIMSSSPAVLVFAHGPIRVPLGVVSVGASFVYGFTAWFMDPMVSMAIL